MKVLFGTDVTLDLLLDRRPHSEAAAVLFSKAERGEIKGFLCATTVTTLHYLVSKAQGNSKARNSLEKLLSFLGVAAVNLSVVKLALEGKGRDFEDEVISQAASAIGASAIITRNIKDFRKSDVPAYLPGEYLEVLRSGRKT